MVEISDKVVIYNSLKIMNDFKEFQFFEEVQSENYISINCYLILLYSLVWYY